MHVIPLWLRGTLRRPKHCSIQCVHCKTSCLNNWHDHATGAWTQLLCVVNFMVVSEFQRSNYVQAAGQASVTCPVRWTSSIVRPCIAFALHWPTSNNWTESLSLSLRSSPDSLGCVAIRSRCVLSEENYVICQVSSSNLVDCLPLHKTHVDSSFISGLVAVLVSPPRIYDYLQSVFIMLLLSTLQVKSIKLSKPTSKRCIKIGGNNIIKWGNNVSIEGDSSQHSKNNKTQNLSTSNIALIWASFDSWF